MSDKLFKKALNKHKAGKFADARDLYKKILKTDSSHLDANYMLGTLLAEQGQLTQALHYLNTARSVAPRSHLVLNNLGNVLRLLGEYQEAARCYENALELNENMAEAWNNLAIIYRRLGDNERAEQYYQRTLTIAPNFVEASYNLGKLFWDAGKLEEALACYQRVIDVRPDYAPVQHALGLYYMKTEDKPRAIECFNRYLELSKEDYYGARLKLAYLTEGEMPEKLPAKLVQETYERKAASWDKDVNNPEMEFLGPQHIRETVNVLLEQKALPASDLDVLDIGCGTGLCGEFLKPLARHLAGVDLSMHMLKQAEKKRLYDFLAEADVAEYMTQHPAQYDLITASGVLIFFGDLSPVLNSAAQALKPGGCFIFTSYKSADRDVEIRDNIHFGHSEQHIRDAAAKAGLEVQSIEPSIHEFDKGQPQAGFVSVVRRPI